MQEVTVCLAHLKPPHSQANLSLSNLISSQKLNRKFKKGVVQEKLASNQNIEKRGNAARETST
jgi:hypothetical protein